MAEIVHLPTRPRPVPPPDDLPPAAQLEADAVAAWMAYAASERAARHRAEARAAELERRLERALVLGPMSMWWWV